MDALEIAQGNALVLRAGALRREAVADPGARVAHAAPRRAAGVFDMYVQPDGE